LEKDDEVENEVENEVEVGADEEEKAAVEYLMDAIHEDKEAAGKLEQLLQSALGGNVEEPAADFLGVSSYNHSTARSNDSCGDDVSNDGGSSGRSHCNLSTDLVSDKKEVVVGRRGDFGDYASRYTALARKCNELQLGDTALGLVVGGGRVSYEYGSGESSGDLDSDRGRGSSGNNDNDSRFSENYNRNSDSGTDGDVMAFLEECKREREKHDAILQMQQQQQLQFE
jgi:hypothetical protein